MILVSYIEKEKVGPVLKGAKAGTQRGQARYSKGPARSGPSARTVPIGFFLPGKTFAAPVSLHSSPPRKRSGARNEGRREHGGSRRVPVALSKPPRCPVVTLSRVSQERIGPSGQRPSSPLQVTHNPSAGVWQRQKCREAGRFSRGCVLPPSERAARLDSRPMGSGQSGAFGRSESGSGFRAGLGRFVARRDFGFPRPMSAATKTSGKRCGLCPNLLGFAPLGEAEAGSAGKQPAEEYPSLR